MRASAKTIGSRRSPRPQFGLLLTSGLLWAIMAGSGCSTPARVGVLDLNEPGWRVQQGQAVWAPKAGLPALAGDLIVASNPQGRCFLQFSKTPFPFVTVHIQADGWRIEFPPQRLSFHGRGRPPARFGWLQLAGVLSGRPLIAPWQFAGQADGRWRLANPGSDESIEGFLTP